MLGAVGKRRDELTLFGLFLLFNVAIALLFSVPVSYPDEYGVLSIANHFAGGVDWPRSPGSYYGYAHSVFFSLLYRLFSDIRTIYVGALCINAVFTALVPVFAYKILNEIVGVQNRRLRVVIAGSIGLYPYFTLYSKLARNETLLFLILFVCIYLVGKNLLATGRVKKAVASVVLAFLACYAYAAHGMGLVFIIALCVIVLLAPLLTRRHVVNYPAFFVALAVFYYLLNVLVKNYLLDAVFHASAGELVNTFEFSFSRMMQNLFTADGLKEIVKGLVARLHYLASATFGTIIPAAVLVLWFVGSTLKKLFKRPRFQVDDKQKGLFTAVLFAVVLLAGGLGISLLNGMATSLQHGGTYYIYGRYFEYMGTPLLLFALGFWATLDIKKKPAFITMASSLVAYWLLTAVTQVFLQHLIEGGLKKRYSVLGVLPFLGNSYGDLASTSNNWFRSYNVLGLAVVVTVVYLVVCLALLKGRPVVSMAVLVACFLYVTAFDLGSTMLEWSNNNYYREYAPYVRMRAHLDVHRELYNAFPNLAILTNQEAVLQQAAYNIPQLQYPDYKVSKVRKLSSVRTMEDPLAEFDNYIIMAPADYELEQIDARYVRIYTDKNCVIWICGDAINSWWAARAP